ncbi:MAG TPA: hypothetical protein ACHBZA_03860 [Arsenophonus apicola]|uniref:hypothetical protein n=1 Tax=Arsenophonus apicola TaxID=2879119 RepID=UPI001CDC29EE|nr:hypothetical protein [Arsenophonus apicola]UBX30629.1 hypothetical protein LDL57_15840 [Arsenophonus apicola]
MNFLKKTLGGLDNSYYFRHFFFGALISVIIFWLVNYNSSGIPASIIIMTIINTLLYPYSRFVYEQIISFIIGDHIFYFEIKWMLTAKFMTMIICWAFSIFIAPFGLFYLYYYHSKQEKEQA